MAPGKTINKPNVWKGGFRRSPKKTSSTTNRADYATFELFAAKHQSGDQVNQDSGNIYARFKPRAREPMPPRRARDASCTATSARVDVRLVLSAMCRAQVSGATQPRSSR